MNVKNQIYKTSRRKFSRNSSMDIETIPASKNIFLTEDIPHNATLSYEEEIRENFTVWVVIAIAILLITIMGNTLVSTVKMITVMMVSTVMMMITVIKATIDV